VSAAEPETGTVPLSGDRPVQPLDGLFVLDFTTLLPGPLASLVLAEAGAEVLKVERPGTGDEMRTYEPRLGHDAVNFALLNRGKKSVVLDLKNPDSARALRGLIERADVILEQFRPGVANRLGIGYEDVTAINPRVVYCSITGYGQTGPRAERAGHDLTYMAETGMLGLTRGADGAPVLPSALVADIAGGAYPAVINILLALLARDRTGAGSRLDVAMTDNLFTLLYWAMGKGWSAGEWPRPADELLTGASPRYNIYRTSDGRWLAAAPLEDRFWATFCEAIELPQPLREDALDPAATRAAVAERLAGRTAEEWRRIFDSVDACCSVVGDVAEALVDPHVAARGLFDHVVEDGHGERIPALPVPVDASFRAAKSAKPYPGLGEHAGELDGGRGDGV
jgi:crotonobetainyl-CoA:carnitine CoA-transferase CaiB-like acyl-CoA transferase